MRKELTKETVYNNNQGLHIRYIDLNASMGVWLVNGDPLYEEGEEAYNKILDILFWEHMYHTEGEWEDNFSPQGEFLIEVAKEERIFNKEFHKTLEG